MSGKAGTNRTPLIIAGILLGIGLGGFVDGIVFHQILQWHHMLTSAGYPATSLGNLEVNTLWDGLFHATTWVMTALGLALLWRAGRRPDVPWSTPTFVGTLAMGWGLFNLVEGIIDHHILGIHHVRTDVPNVLAWDLGFLLFGAILLGLGSGLVWKGREERATAPVSPETLRP